MDELTVKSRVQLNRTVTVLWHVQNKSHSKKQKKIMDFVAVSEFRKVALSLIQQQQTLLWSEVTHWLSWFVDLRWYQRQFSTSSNIVQDLVVFCSVPLLSLVICCCFFFFIIIDSNLSICLVQWRSIRKSLNLLNLLSSFSILISTTDCL